MDVTQVCRGLAEREVDVAAQHILQKRGTAAVRHELEFRSGLLLEQDGGNVGRTADTHCPRRRLAIHLLQPCNQAFDVVCRQVLARDDPDRRVGDQRHRLEILHHVVIQMHGRGVEHVRLDMADAHRVAVGRRMGDATDPNGAAGTTDIFDDDRLAKRILHAVGQDARDGVGRAAGRVGHHEGDRPRRIILRHCAKRAGGKHAGGNNGGSECEHFAHEFSSHDVLARCCRA
jgi:hypothetical protein